MRIVDLIVKKRDKQELTTEEINAFVEAYTIGEVPDYQASAWAMAVLLNGMTSRETTDLTLAMANSGDTLDLSGVVEIAVDKHSTGGVGDKTTLAVEPIVASTGLPVGKMSGRGLGFSGGTLDKMESIPGYRTDLTEEEFLAQLKEVGVVLTGQTGELAPADGKLYGLRDVTGTVPSMPLIASSIMSKKIAAGAQRIVLDVKVGVGAFMETQEEARELAEIMVEIGRLAGRQAVALISDMNQPLGIAVGNALEVVEAIETLQGGGPYDFREHSLEVATHLLVLGGKAENEEAARQMAEETISSGAAWEKFRQLVEVQGGDVSYIDDPSKLPKAKLIETVKAERGGYLAEINAREVGETAVTLGAGRQKKGDPVNHAVGIMIHRNVGDQLAAGDDLFEIHAGDEKTLQEAKQRVMAAHVWSDEAVEPLPLFYGVVK
ncbi:MAG: thymidine phosphorylase [Chloroflexi bacterium]|nr:MAG: thymidine phosphorylase [Chloroflexota bacterium]MBL1196209.1 thymidine phosphorylase [Chloroflexota bacterium]NOH13502.1 thymidine phosphorylase [Chloroflexota bacterium]